MEPLLVWLFIGLVAGALASAVVGGGYGPAGDIVVGIAGAFIGGYVMRAVGATNPFHGLPGDVFIAFVGAIVLLVVLRIIRRTFSGAS